MKIDDYTNYNDWEFSARMAFDQMNEYRQVYTELSFDKKVKLAHQFYDFVFRCNDRPIEWESENCLGADKKTADHPFSARLAHRAIMNENQHFLDDFDLFKLEFYKLLQKINMTSKENSGVKIKPDHYGDVIVPQYITERYNRVRFFKNKKTREVSNEFPLDIPEWYGKYELSRIQANLSKFFG
jgi:hypothetical protein